MKQIIFILSILLMTPFLSAQIIHVPADYSTIQAAINAAADGDTVLVAEGTYLENINFRKKVITLASQFLIDADTSHISRTIIDGSSPAHPDSGSTVTMLLAQDTTTVLCGFTIQGGTGTGPYEFILGGKTARTGGGVLHAGGKIINNIIKNNEVYHTETASGGGLSGGEKFDLEPDTELTLVIRNNIFTQNKVHSDTHYTGGGGLEIDLSNQLVIIENNRIFNNLSESDIPYKAMGGGMQLGKTTSNTGVAIIRNNFIDKNSIHSEESFGGGVFYLLLYDGPTTSFHPTEIYNNVISNNHSDFNGGGICTWYLWATDYDSPVDPVFTNNTIINNTANHGSGLCVIDSKLALYNNIFWNEPTEDNTEIFDRLFRNDSWPFSENVAQIYSAFNNIRGGWPGIGNVNSDPLLESDTAILTSTSPCIGRGVDSVYFADVWYYAPDLDFNGTKRKMASSDKRIDMGAVESSFNKPIFPSPDRITIINVPEEESTIQAAINNAVDGDTVLVDEGIYYENINFRGKAITVASTYIVDDDEAHITQTIIDGSKPIHADSASVVMMLSGEDTTSILHGFTLTGGKGTKKEENYKEGGGVVIFGGGIIEHNIIMNNHVDFEGVIGLGLGGGISAVNNDERTAIIRNNVISDNSVVSSYYVNGGGISIFGSNFNVTNNRVDNNICNSYGSIAYGAGIGWYSFNTPDYHPHVKIRNNVIFKNQLLCSFPDKDDVGGGIRLSSEVSVSEVDVSNNLVYENSSAGTGGGISFYSPDGVVCRNNTFYNNSAGINGKSVYQNGGSVIFFNNIVWTETYTKDQIVLYTDAGTPAFDAQYNLIKGGWNGNSNFMGDPDLSAETFKPSISSLCIDRGAASIEAKGITYFAPGKDLNDAVRPFAGNDYTGVDLGAIESEFELVDYFEMIVKKEVHGGPCNVTVMLYAEGGVPPYTYYMDGVEQTGNIIGDLCSGTYNFSIRDASGAEVSRNNYSVVGLDEELSDQAGLKIYPNPANETIHIRFDLQESLPVRISLLNLLGQEECLLLNETRMAGEQEVKFDVSGLSPGVYFVRLASDHIESCKLILR